MKSVFFIVLLAAGFTYAQVSGDSTVVLGLAKADSAIPLQLSAGILGGLIFAIELIMRFFPTAEPRSLFLLASKVFGLVGSIFTKISGLFDQVVQNLKPKA